MRLSVDLPEQLTILPLPDGRLPPQPEHISELAMLVLRLARQRPRQWTF
jgi:hypothetical protein